MAYRTVLAVNFGTDRLRLLKHVSLIAQANVKAVTEEEVAEIHGLGQESAEEGQGIPEGTEPVTQEAIILCGFDRAAAHELLEAIKRGKLKHIPLKAMLTPNNITWNIYTVLYELRQEHEYFRQVNSK